jgi:hypothetical protein
LLTERASVEHTGEGVGKCAVKRHTEHGSQHVLRRSGDDVFSATSRADGDAAGTTSHRGMKAGVIKTSGPMTGTGGEAGIQLMNPPNI